MSLTSRQIRALTPRQVEIMELRLKGWSLRAIALHLGVHHANVGRAVQRAEKALGRLEEMEDSSGAVDAALESGVGMGSLHSGWIKTDRSSIYFMAPKEREEEEAGFLSAIRQTLEAYEPVALPEPKVDLDQDLLSLYGLWDLHLGLHSWAKETGEHYDIKRAKEVAYRGMTDLMSRTPDSAVGVVLAGGDFTHADDERAETPTSKHALDVDGRFYKTAHESLGLIISLVELAARKHDKVVVRILPGNHDVHAAKWLSVALGYLFSKDERVEVEKDPSEWLFLVHGKSLIVSHHGHRRKPQEMAGMIPALKPEEWGRSLYRYFLHGHVHHERLGLEHNGVLCRSFSAMTARDSYAAAMGFKAGRSMSALIFHKDYGLYAEARHPILEETREKDGKR